MKCKVFLLLVVIFSAKVADAQICSYASPSLDVQGPLYTRGNIYTLNKAGNDWITWATRNTSFSEVKIDLANINNAFFLGNVGIGTMSPGTNLDVVKVTSGIIGTIQDVFTINAGPQTYNYNDRWGNGGGTGLLFKQQHYTSGGSLASARIATVQTDQVNNSGKPALVFQTGDAGTLNEAMRITYNRNVGIGTSSPGTNLDVVNVTSGIIGTIQDVLTINAGPQTNNYNDRWGNGGGTGLLFKQQHYASVGSLASARIATVQTDQVNNSGKPALVFQTGDAGTLNEAMRISYNGNVGIGATSPAYKLDVCGTIRAKEVKVDLLGGCDFVFKDGYELRDLKNLERYIKTNQHLPEIDSEKEMVDNGVNMKDLQMKLLQKIEELTLYTIEQNKKIETLEQEIQEIKKK